MPDDDESDENEDDDRSPFERMSSKMEDLSSGEGQLFKKILSQGTGNVVPVEALVQSMYMYISYI